MEILLSMLVFSILLVLIFSFAFLNSGFSPENTASGVIWVSLAFSGSLGLSRAWDRERESGGLYLMLLSPASREAIYLAKVANIFFFMSITAVPVVFLIGVLFEISFSGQLISISILLGLGILGYSIVGSFFGALTARGKTKDFLFFIIFHPLMFPVIIAGTMGTNEIFSAQPVYERTRLFMSMLVAFNCVAGVMAFFSFEKLAAGSGGSE